MPKNNRANEYRRNAHGYFTQTQKRDELLRAEQATAQKAEKEKIARLRALRLANESTTDSSGETIEES
jgi:hypothetical protein